MTTPKVGGTRHKWMVEDAQALLMALADKHKRALVHLREGDPSDAALELADAGLTLIEMQRLISEIQLLIVHGERHE